MSKEEERAILPFAADAEVANTNAAADSTTKAAIFFLATALYLAVSAGGTDSAQLLLNGNVNFPILNTGVSCWLFYALAPLLLVILHTRMLLDEYFLAKKIEYLNARRIEYLHANEGAPSPDLTFSLTMLPVAIALGYRATWYVRLIVQMVLLLVNLVVPIVLLLLLQRQFLAYHDLWITRGQRLLLFVECSLIVTFFFHPKGLGRIYVRRLDATTGAAAEPSSPSGILTHCVRVVWRSRFLIGNALVFAACVLLALWLSFCRIVVPVDCTDESEDRLIRHGLRGVYSLLQRLISPYLVVDEHALAVASPEGRSSMSKINAAGRDLRCASFRHVDLQHANFRGALLAGARFSDVILIGAQFGRGADGGHGFESASSEGSQLPSDAPNLRAGRRTDLTQAVFERVDLAQADFSYAHLERAQFSHAIFKDTAFNGVDADEADLRSAEGSAVFDSASLRGASLFEAKLQKSSFSRAHMEVANLVGAHLEGAVFSGAALVGADLRGAWLAGAENLSLEGVDLTRAHLDGLNFCESRKTKGPAPDGRVEPVEAEVPIEIGRNRVTYADLRDAFLTGTCLEVADPTLFYRQQQVATLLTYAVAHRAEYTSKTIDQYKQRLLKGAPDEDLFYQVMVRFLIDGEHRDELIHYLAKAVTRPAVTSRFDATMACAIMRKLEARQHSAKPPGNDSYAGVDDEMVRRLSKIANNCSVLLADPGAPEPGSAGPVSP